jgi:hypothetical protein
LLLLLVRAHAFDCVFAKFICGPRQIHKNTPDPFNQKRQHNGVLTVNCWSTKNDPTNRIYHSSCSNYVLPERIPDSLRRVLFDIPQTLEETTSQMNGDEICNKEIFFNGAGGSGGDASADTKAMDGADSESVNGGEADALHNAVGIDDAVGVDDMEMDELLEMDMEM